MIYIVVDGKLINVFNSLDDAEKYVCDRIIFEYKSSGRFYHYRIYFSELDYVNTKTTSYYEYYLTKYAGFYVEIIQKYKGVVLEVKKIILPEIIEKYDVDIILTNGNTSYIFYAGK